MSYEDRIYHDGYLDGYYASMALCHADPEMAEEMPKEDRRARRKKKLKRYGNRAKYYSKSYLRGIPAGLAIGTGLGALTGAYDANVFMRHSGMKYKRVDDEDDFDYEKHMKRGRRHGAALGAIAAVPVGYAGAMGVALRNPERRRKILSSMRRTGDAMWATGNSKSSEYMNKVADGFERMAYKHDKFFNRFKKSRKKA